MTMIRPHRASTHSMARVFLGVLALCLGSVAMAEEPATAVFSQIGYSEGSNALSLGLHKDWNWSKTFNSGRLSGQWQVEVGRWMTKREDSTVVGLTPAFRFHPAAWGDRWFVDFGTGANAIFPKYHPEKKRFSTTFNFGTHAGIGRHIGVDGTSELTLRIAHYSNARIERPNPGENFLQVRYAKRWN
ncbi:acyloxyacyl hydrolase [Pseudoxanthomonas jiangsuensis]|uniref:acyloxyacyl hydrolase n=1 Tax=Pseudoxanthomonas jiangsuensis TaxID=619688 RepID=UPI0013914E9E|nr:acyloxyacyl hydrolase [Pseudoxanthomonas jiangsuensis]